MAGRRTVPSGRTRSVAGAWIPAGIVAAAVWAAGCTANRPAETRVVTPPVPPERTSDRGDRFALLTPMGQIAPEDAPRVAPVTPIAPVPVRPGVPPPKPPPKAWQNATPPPPPPPPPPLPPPPVKRAAGTPP